MRQVENLCSAASSHTEGDFDVGNLALHVGRIVKQRDELDNTLCLLFPLQEFILAHRKELTVDCVLEFAVVQAVGEKR